MSLLLLINFVSIMVTSSNISNQLILRECPFQDLTNITIYVPHVSDCKKFYKCYNAERILFRCPKDTYFNPYHCVCDQNQRLNCNLLSRIIPRRISNKLQAKSTNESASITGTISTLNTKIPQITNNDLTTNPTIKSTYNAELTTSIITTKNKDKQTSGSTLQSSVQSENNCTEDISSEANTTLSNDSTEKSNTLYSESILQISSYPTLYPKTTTTINIIKISTSKETTLTTANTTINKTSILTPSLPLSNSTSNQKYMPTVAQSPSTASKSSSPASDSSFTSYAKANLSTDLSPVITKALSETTIVIKLDQSNSPTGTPASNSVTNITILPTKESITSVISNTTLQFTYRTDKQLKPTMASEDFDYILRLSRNSNKNKNSKINKRLYNKNSTNKTYIYV